MAAVPTDEGVDAAHVLTLSAHSPAALQALAQSWIHFLTETPASVADLCSYRLAAAHSLRSQARRGRSVKRRSQRPTSGLCRIKQLCPTVCGCGRLASAAPRVGFVFSGQGPQWHAMGQELLTGEPVFREVVTTCDALLRPCRAGRCWRNSA